VSLFGCKLSSRSPLELGKRCHAEPATFLSDMRTGQSQSFVITEQGILFSLCTAVVVTDLRYMTDIEYL